MSDDLPAPDGAETVKSELPAVNDEVWDSFVITMKVSSGKQCLGSQAGIWLQPEQIPWLFFRLSPDFRCAVREVVVENPFCIGTEVKQSKMAV